MLLEQQDDRNFEIKVKYDLDELKKKDKITFASWKFRGTASRCRLMFHYLGIEFDQIFFVDETDRYSWQYLKDLMFHDNPASSLPCLIDGKKVICENLAIILYLVYKAKKTELLPNGREQEMKIALAHTMFRDIFGRYEYAVYCGAKIQTTKTEVIKFMRIHFKRFLQVLDHKEWIIGKLTYFDIIFGQGFQQVFLYQPKLKEEFPEIEKYIDRVWNLDGIKEYVNSEAFKSLPVNYPVTAKWF